MVPTAFLICLTRLRLSQTTLQSASSVIVRACVRATFVTVELVEECCGIMLQLPRLLFVCGLCCVRYRHSPRAASGEGSKEAGAPAKKSSAADTKQRQSKDVGLRGPDSTPTGAIAGNVKDAQALSLTRTPSAQSVGETIASASSASSAAAMATQAIARSSATNGQQVAAGTSSVTSIGPRRRSTSSDARDRPEKLLPHAVPSVVTPRLPEQVGLATSAFLSAAVQHALPLGAIAAPSVLGNRGRCAETTVTC